MTDELEAAWRSTVRTVSLSVAAAAGLLVCGSNVAWACYCDPVPFEELATTADFVVIGVVTSDQREWRNDAAEHLAYGVKSWSVRIRTVKTIKGRAPATPFLVGGGSTSCDVGGSESLELGREYAFAFQQRQRAQGYYRLDVCWRSAAPMRNASSPDGITEADVRKWSHAKPRPRKAP
jgi:hypothetical protein